MGGGTASDGQTAALRPDTNESGRREAAQRESSSGLAIQALRNIATGAWNAGRKEPISVEDYARDTLAVVLWTWNP